MYRQNAVITAIMLLGVGLLTSMAADGAMEIVDPGCTLGPFSYGYVPDALNPADQSWNQDGTTSTFADFDSTLVHVATTPYGTASSTTIHHSDISIPTSPTDSINFTGSGSTANLWYGVADPLELDLHSSVGGESDFFVAFELTTPYYLNLSGNLVHTDTYEQQAGAVFADLECNGVSLLYPTHPGLFGLNALLLPGEYTFQVDVTAYANPLTSPSSSSSYHFDFDLTPASEEPVPEPISMVMLGCLGAGMAAARKLRRRK